MDEQKDAAVVAKKEFIPEVDELTGNPLCGVRGWLLFFCVLTSIVHPLQVVAAIANGKQKPMEILIATILAGTSCLVGILLWIRSERALEMTKYYLYGLIVFGCLIFLLTLMMDVHKASTIASAEKIADSLMILPFPLIWTVYFKKSERVRLTYGRNF